MDRWDETWHRLREWTNGQAPSERLAAQVLYAEGYSDIDPSHPLGGRDARKDAVLQKGGERWIMAAYFPRGQQPFGEIKDKFRGDHAGVESNQAAGMAFVTNQELTLAERKELERCVDAPVDIFHLERLTGILDRPGMAGVRQQYLRIPAVGPTAPPRSFQDILDAGAPTPGAPSHWMVPPGMLLLRVVAVPVPTTLRHPDASNPRGALEAASRESAALASAWPVEVSVLARRLKEGWEAIRPHHWGAGRIHDDAESLAQQPFAAASFVTQTSVLSVDRTWPTRIHDDAGNFAFDAAREPEVVAETLVALRLAGGLLERVAGLEAVDVAFLMAAAPTGDALVSSERAVSGRRFGKPAGHLPKPVVADVRTHYTDSARFELEDLLEPSRAARQLVGPWLASFRGDDLLARLTEE